MNYTVFNEEVLYTTEPVTRLNLGDIAKLKSLAVQNPRQRVRLCAHPNVEDRLHEMLMVHAKGAYVRPHKHINKSESYHIVEGRLNVVFFEDDGRIKDVLHMAPAGSGEIFYYRLSTNWYHTLIPVSEVVAFHETTNGPFLREETVFAPWAPPEEDRETARQYMCHLLDSVMDRGIALRMPPDDTVFLRPVDKDTNRQPALASGR